MNYIILINIVFCHPGALTEERFRLAGTERKMREPGIQSLVVLITNAYIDCWYHLVLDAVDEQEFILQIRCIVERFSFEDLRVGLWATNNSDVVRAKERRVNSRRCSNTHLE